MYDEECDAPLNVYKQKCPDLKAQVKKFFYRVAEAQMSTLLINLPWLLLWMQLIRGFLATFLIWFVVDYSSSFFVSIYSQNIIEDF